MPDERLARLSERLLARARPPLAADLVPVLIAGQRVGLAQPEIAHFLRRSNLFACKAGELMLVDEGMDADGRTRLLARAADGLRNAGLITGWRDEQLSVRATPDGPELAAIERSACRPLGIATTAVHLNAYTDNGDVIVARRAAHKPIDPGRWDNLVGGMVPAGETLESALEREAWEEAGLELHRVAIQRGRSFHVRRPVREGLQSETIHVYDASLAPDASLKNQDGEVDAIERRSTNDVVDAIEADQFTLESALVMLESLTRLARLPTAEGLFV